MRMIMILISDFVDSFSFCWFEWVFMRLVTFRHILTDRREKKITLESVETQAFYLLNIKVGEYISHLLQKKPVLSFPGI